jgi:hypothetical protein
MRIINSIIILVFLGISATQISSCTKNKVPLPELVSDCPDTIQFSTFIQPLMVANCSTSGCHDSFGAGGYTLETYNQIKSNAEIILKSIRYDGVTPMPQGQPKLSENLATEFNCWIVQGALDN